MDVFVVILLKYKENTLFYKHFFSIWIVWSLRSPSLPFYLRMKLLPCRYLFHKVTSLATVFNLLHYPCKAAFSSPPLLSQHSSFTFTAFVPATAYEQSSISLILQPVSAYGSHDCIPVADTPSSIPPSYTPSAALPLSQDICGHGEFFTCKYEIDQYSEDTSNCWDSHLLNLLF